MEPSRVWYHMKACAKFYMLVVNMTYSDVPVPGYESKMRVGACAMVFLLCLHSLDGELTYIMHGIEQITTQVTSFRFLFTST